MTSTAIEIDRPSYDRATLKTNRQLLMELIPDLSQDALKARCGACGASLSWGQWFQRHGGEFQCCHRCGEYLKEDPCGDLTPDEADAVREPGYFDREWFHVSEHEDWAEHVLEAEDGDLLVHAGDELAATARADHFRLYTPSWRPIELYLHRFRLTTAEGFSKEILDDMGDRWQTTLSKPYPMALTEIEGQHREATEFTSLSPTIPGIGYYNRFEVPGSISILFHGALIDPSTVETRSLGPAPKVRTLTVKNIGGKWMQPA